MSTRGVLGIPGKMLPAMPRHMTKRARIKPIICSVVMPEDSLNPRRHTENFLGYAVRVTERGCVVLDQPQHAGNSPRLRTPHALRLVFDTAALRPALDAPEAFCHTLRPCRNTKGRTLSCWARGSAG